MARRPSRISINSSNPADSFVGHARRSDVRIPHEVRGVERILLLSGDDRQPVVWLPAEIGLGDENVVVVEAIFKRLLFTVVLLACAEGESREPFAPQFGLGIQPQAEAIARLLESVASVRHLRFAILVLIAQPEIAVELQLGHRIAEFEFSRRGLREIALKIGPDILRLLLREHSLANERVNVRGGILAIRRQDRRKKRGAAQQKRGNTVKLRRRGRATNKWRVGMFSLVNCGRCREVR